MSEPDNQRPDKWSFTYFIYVWIYLIKRTHNDEGQFGIWRTVPSRIDQALRLKLVDCDGVCN